MKEYIIPDEFLDYETKASADGQGFLHELVRCGECKYHWKNGGDCVAEADFFCSDGERRTDEQQT